MKLETVIFCFIAFLILVSCQNEKEHILSDLSEKYEGFNSQILSASTCDDIANISQEIEEYKKNNRFFDFYTLRDRNVISSEEVDSILNKWNNLEFSGYRKQLDIINELQKQLKTEYQSSSNREIFDDPRFIDLFTKNMNCCTTIFSIMTYLLS